MAKPKGIERSEVIQRMRAALKVGVSASAFIRDMTTRGIAYRRTTMLADWRSVGDIQKKTGLLRYVRKDRVPTVEIAQAEGWKMSSEYMFKVKVQTRLRPGEPVLERFVNIMHDRPVTPGQLEQEAGRLFVELYLRKGEKVVAIVPETAIHRAS